MTDFYDPKIFSEFKKSLPQRPRNVVTQLKIKSFIELKELSSSEIIELKHGIGWHTIKHIRINAEKFTGQRFNKLERPRC